MKYANFAMMCFKMIVLWVLALLGFAHCEVNDTGPHNVVGYFMRNVSLTCHRNAAGGVRWSYSPPGTGSDSEQQVPGKYHYSGSNYGRHSLVLEDLRRADAGLYVCRSTHEPASFQQAAALVVVLADEPLCRSRGSGPPSSNHSFIVSCRIFYSGMLNLTLSLLRSHDNHTLARKNYTSNAAGSWWNVEAKVPINTTDVRMNEFSCRAEFYSSITSGDIAKNQPAYIQVACAAPREHKPIHEEPISSSMSTATASTRSQPASLLLTTAEAPTVSFPILNTIEDLALRNGSQNRTAIALSSVALILVGLSVFTIIVAFILVKLRANLCKKPRKRGSTGEEPVSTNLREETNGAGEGPLVAGNDNDTASAKLLDSSSTACTPAPDRVSRNTPRQSRGHVGTSVVQQPSSDISTSPSIASMQSDECSLHSASSAASQTPGTDDATSESDDNDNENTLVDKAQRERLAQDAAAMNVVVSYQYQHVTDGENRPAI